jgi:NitT/TauT family transport system substrate-binding protein
MTIRASATALAGLAFAASLSFAASAQTTPVTVVVPNPSAITFMPLHVAIGEGYFEEEGLELTVEAVNGSAAVLQTLASGQAQIGAPGPGPVLSARARGEDVVFIYNLYPKSLFGLVVPEDSDVEEPAGLAGATVGVGTADGAEVAFARGILSDAGLSEGEDYEFLPVGDGGTAAAAILNEEVGGYAAAVPDAVIIEERGIPLREITPEEYLGYFGNGWAATRDYLTSNPEVVEGFGRAMARATAFGMDPANTEAVLEHTAAGNPQEGEDRDFAEALLEATRERMSPLDEATPWGYQPPEGWERWHQSQIDTGALSEPLDDLEAAYSNEFVETWNEGL